MTIKYLFLVFDILYYLYVSTDGEFRSQHLEEILRTYWDTLSLHLGQNPPEVGSTSFPFQFEKGFWSEYLRWFHTEVSVDQAIRTKKQSCALIIEVRFAVFQAYFKVKLDLHLAKFLNWHGSRSKQQLHKEPSFRSRWVYLGKNINYPQNNRQPQVPSSEKKDKKLIPSPFPLTPGLQVHLGGL